MSHQNSFQKKRYRRNTEHLKIPTHLYMKRKDPCAFNTITMMHIQINVHDFEFVSDQAMNCAIYIIQVAKTRSFVSSGMVPTAGPIDCNFQSIVEDENSFDFDKSCFLREHLSCFNNGIIQSLKLQMCYILIGLLVGNAKTINEVYMVVSSIQRNSRPYVRHRSVKILIKSRSQMGPMFYLTK